METNAAVSSVEMANEVYVAAMEGNVKFVEECQNNEYLFQKTRQKNNILHIAAQSEKIGIIEAVLKKFPNNRELLLCEGNSKKDTPLHIAAEVGNLDVVKKMVVEGDAEKALMRMKNLKGNTAAHEAIIHGNVKIAIFLLNKDPGLASVLNESEEAPLHLAVKNPASFAKKTATKASIQRVFRKRSAAISLVPGEDITSVIKKLVEEAGYVTCWADDKGFTPLHRAASLSAPYNQEIITYIIKQWPQSAEVCDKNSGNSILHLLIKRIPLHRDVKMLLSMKELYNLRNCQDHQGNTPLHIAALKMDIVMVQALLESGANSDIMNLQGVDASTLIQQQIILEKLKTQSMTTEECEAADKGDIAFLEERLSNSGVDFLQSQDSSNGQNILHKLFKLPIELPITVVLKYYGLIEQVMSSYPALVCQTDLNGDTPIHVLVQNNVNERLGPLIARRLDLCKKFIVKLKEEATSNNEAPFASPWRVQNVDGNTPFHLALIANNKAVLEKLMEYNTLFIDLCNKRGETPYHLLKDNDFLLRRMQFPSERVPPTDNDGFTPIMRAIEGGWEDTAIQLIHDKSCWWLGTDKKGNTPFHMAIQHHQFKLFSKILDELGKDGDFNEVNFWKNQAKETSSDLIGELDVVPPDLEKQILKIPKLRGIRSAWSIPKSQLQNYMSSVNVIAALLTTITFTAAFTVPGGLDQEDGTPLLLPKSIAFQVFMVSDVIAMCLSMMVLFCLLWIVATNKRNSVMIQDFAITLLLGSFVATLLTFMAGVYATISSINPRIAIATLVLCSLLMLLVHRFVLTNLVIPFKNIIKHPIYSAKLLYEAIRHTIDDIRGRWRRRPCC